MPKRPATRLVTTDASHDVTSGRVIMVACSLVGRNDKRQLRVRAQIGRAQRIQQAEAQAFVLGLCLARDLRRIEPARLQPNQRLDIRTDSIDIIRHRIDSTPLQWCHRVMSMAGEVTGVDRPYSYNDLVALFNQSNVSATHIKAHQRVDASTTDIDVLLHTLTDNIARNINRHTRWLARTPMSTEMLGVIVRDTIKYSRITFDNRPIVRLM